MPNATVTQVSSEGPVRRCATPRCGRTCDPDWLPYCQHCFATDRDLVRWAAEYRARRALRLAGVHA